MCVKNIHVETNTRCNNNINKKRETKQNKTNACEQNIILDKRYMHSFVVQLHGQIFNTGHCSSKHMKKGLEKSTHTHTRQYTVSYVSYLSKIYCLPWIWMLCRKFLADTDADVAFKPKWIFTYMRRSTHTQTLTQSCEYLNRCTSYK